MTSKISRKDELSRRFTSLEILDRWKPGDKFTSRCEKLNRNESTIRTVRKNKNKSKIRARVSAATLSSLKKSSRTKDLSLTETERTLFNRMDRKLQQEENSFE